MLLCVVLLNSAKKCLKSQIAVAIWEYFPFIQHLTLVRLNMSEIYVIKHIQYFPNM